MGGDRKKEERRTADEESPQENAPKPHIKEGLPELVPVELSVGAGRTLLRNALNGDLTLLRGEEPGGSG